MLLKLAYYGEPVLRQKAKPVANIDDEIRQFVVDMIETMHHHNGAGLAAPQVHRSLAIMLTNIPKRDLDGKLIHQPERVFINPKLLKTSQEVWHREEGCLSLPDVYGEVPRPLTIDVETTTLEGERVTLTLEGWEARAFLHENDHLNGVLFFDRMSSKARKELDPLLRAVKKKYGPKR